MNTKSVYAPVDAIVRAMVNRNAAVQVGDLLIELYSPELERYLHRIETALSTIDIVERPFVDGRVDDLISLIPVGIKAVESQSNAAAVLFSVDRIWTNRPKQYEAATLLIEKHGKELEQKYAQRRVTDVKELLQLAKLELEQEKGYLLVLQSALVVRATRTGRFIGKLCVGTFVEKGSVCGDFIYE